MKNILKSAALLVLCLGALTACDEDRDDNPTYQQPTTFRLNMPAIAANNVIDLANTDSITLTYDQPNYGGFPMAVDYTTEISTDEGFTEGTTLTLTAVHSTVTNVSAVLINQTVIEQYQAVHGEDTYPEGEFPLYIRVKAQPTGLDLDAVYSNTITLPHCIASYRTPDVVVPENLYVCGSNIGTAWKTWQKLAKPYDVEGSYYGLIYIPEGGGSFKFGTKEEDWTGHSAIATFNDNAEANITAAADDNIVFGKAGWYTIEFQAKVKGNNLEYTLNVSPGQVYIIGTVAGMTNWAADPNWALTAPADQTGDWVSPAFTAAGELRAFINVPGRDWWRTEFTLYQGTTVYYRDVNVPDNWAGSELGSDYSVNVTPGQRLYVNFDNGTGRVE